MSQLKIFDVEIAEGDEVYIASDVRALNVDQAVDFAIVMFGGLINESSEIINVEEKLIH
jgi:hypothetical protein|tara:strand:- start:413 stop:589 length:177 start_codon:yes stop_codon:yes gene_type:complete